MAVDQLTHRDAGRRQLDARLLHPPRHRPGADTRMPRLAEGGEPCGTLLDDVADPPQRLAIVVERRPAEQPDVGDVGRAVARQAALALDRFEHRALLAADIGTGAAPQFAESGGAIPAFSKN